MIAFLESMGHARKERLLVHRVLWQHGIMRGEA